MVDAGDRYLGWPVGGPGASGYTWSVGVQRPRESRACAPDSHANRFRLGVAWSVEVHRTEAPRPFWNKCDGLCAGRDDASGAAFARRPRRKRGAVRSRHDAKADRAKQVTQLVPLRACAKFSPTPGGGGAVGTPSIRGSLGATASALRGAGRFTQFEETRWNRGFPFTALVSPSDPPTLKRHASTGSARLQPPNRHGSGIRRDQALSFAQAISPRDGGGEP